MDYLTDIYRLSYIKRYSNVPKIKEESVAEHAFFVSAIVIKLHEEYEFDLGKALLLAVSHDMAEMELNDCPHIIKKKYPSIALAYEECEKEVRELLPKPVSDAIQEFDEASTIEAKIVQLADAIQCIQFSRNEVDLGNQGYMRVVLNNSYRRKMNLEEGIKSHARKQD
jgi:5'-deoxynucleotidase YfbR-like HD superfamily hydrolase